MSEIISNSTHAAFYSLQGLHITPFQTLSGTKFLIKTEDAKLLENFERRLKIIGEIINDAK